MAKAEKFGTFGGVFVPSVLTILGVIMYLRFGWVVGNAGLVGTIIIILIAHVISITTGLSVSSIATDKKVKAGGIYYILSRSLGLPIGGAIGIALFIATALSISMYIVGFGESFNNAIGLSHPDMDVTERVNNLRITGSITLLVITTIVLVSTSLAIKTQYYILGAIVLSLVSIFAGGLFIDHGFAPSSTQLLSGGGSVSMETVFAIFFPAVTGFTAGIAMSGDLKDPKKSIPLGTMAAIGVGLVVYISLAVFLANTIDSNVLREDHNILGKIALFSAYGAPFLLAGIWGATLSSAFGGILGGPRILQAMSLDKVTPKLFGKGVGKSNEPRNALLFSFIIAEAGILIGELDLIAPIVSMFYLAAYGFINLTSALESWSGSDFRPTFKIPKAVSLIGALATFAVMFKLDMMAMFGSFIVIGIIFLYLTKKQINLGFSDVWQGVWSEVIRAALFRVNQKTPDKRSWRPNIILFSGDPEKRPYLLEYGKRLVGRLGLLSNFDLVEDLNTQVPFAKREQPVENLEAGIGVFTRQYSCNDVYSGIERIAETYGFSGLEPNTILMGWARYSKDPLRFSQLIKQFQQLDYCLLIMDYDQSAGFGNKKRIDIWWEGEGRHISFALTISRFLNTSDDWQEAAIRLYILADTSQVDDMVIYQTLDHVQEELRVKVDVKIINAALDHRSYELIQSESSGADLVYLELPDLEEGGEKEFFQKTDALCKELGTVILYKASKEFDSINLGLRKRDLESPEIKSVAGLELDSAPSSNIPMLISPAQTVMAENFQALDSSIARVIENYYQDYLVPFAQNKIQLILSIQEFTSETYERLRTNLQTESESVLKIISQLEREFLDQVLHDVVEFQSHELRSQEQTLLAAADYVATEINETIVKCPPSLLVKYNKSLLSDGDYHNFNWMQRLKSKISKAPLEYRFNFQKLATLQLKQHTQKAFLDIQKQINQDSDQFGGDLRKYIRRTAAGMHNLKTVESNHELTSENLAVETAQIDSRFEGLKDKVGSKIIAYRDYLLADNRMHLQQFVSDVDAIAINKVVRSQLKSQKQWNRLHLQITETVAAWGYNQPLYFNVHQLEIRLLSLQNDLWEQVVQLATELTQLSTKKLLKQIDQLISSLHRMKDQYEIGKNPKLNITHQLADFSVLTESVGRFIEATKQLIDDLPTQMLVPNIQNNTRDTSEEIDTIEVSPRDVVNYLFQKNLIAPLEEHAGQLQPVVSKTDHTLADVLQVVNLSLNSAFSEVDSGPENFSAKVIEVIDDEIARLLDSKRQVEEFINQTTDGLKKNYKEVSENLNAYALIKYALDFDYYLLTQKQTQVINRFSAYSQNIKNYILAGLTKLYYRRSEGLIAAKRFQNLSLDAGTRTDRISKMINEVIPDDRVLEDLPFYYKQLFLRPHNVNEELWLVRNQDTVQADTCVAHYQRVQSGGLLILGAPLSGKTYLSEFIAKSYFDVDRMFMVNPPDEGSIDTKVFERSIKKSLKHYGDLESTFENMKTDSVLIFNDAELWWERDENGFEVLDTLIDLIDEYSHKCLFMVNMNILSFQLINKIKKIEDSFFKILKTNPFNAEELKDVILLRHKTSRLKFEITGKQEDELGEWNLAKLFTNYFDLAQGNVGVALQQWISNIKSISDNGVIRIRYPKYPDQEVLGNIDKDRAILLIQFILHKRLSAERLLGILKIPKEDLDKRLEVLNRLDILRQRNGVWEINRFLQPFLIAVFEEDLLI